MGKTSNSAHLWAGICLSSPPNARKHWADGCITIAESLRTTSRELRERRSDYLVNVVQIIARVIAMAIAMGEANSRPVSLVANTGASAGITTEQTGRKGVGV